MIDNQYPAHKSQKTEEKLVKTNIVVLWQKYVLYRAIFSRCVNSIFPPSACCFHPRRSRGMKLQARGGKMEFTNQLEKPNCPCIRLIFVKDNVFHNIFWHEGLINFLQQFSAFLWLSQCTQFYEYFGASFDIFYLNSRILPLVSSSSSVAQ